jgi:Kef-type K+ transport system membrane component KefB
LPEHSDAVQSLKSLPVEDLLFPVLVQLAVIIAAARLFGVLARKVGQPAVVGEILAGLALGPSLLGWLLPGVFATVFRPPLPGVPDDLAAAAFPKVFEVLSQIGLMLLMFLIGLEVEVAHLRVKGKATAAVAVAGIVVPFVLGVAAAAVIHPALEPHPTAGPVSAVGLALILGVALSVTAIPTLGRILIELGVSRTRLAAVALAAAAANDAVVWVLLGFVGPIARSGDGGVAWTGPAATIGLTVGFAVLLYAIGRPVLGRYLDRSLTANAGHLSPTPLAVVLVALFGCGVATNRIGVSAVFGAFLLGAVLADRPGLRRAAGERLGDVVNALLLPIFFTYSGLRTDLGSLGGLWWVAAVVLAAAVVGKFGGCTLAARLGGFRWREAAQVGVMMNTRGLMGLVVINVGYDAGVIPNSLFCALVLMAVVTTLLTAPLLLRLRHGTELEDPIRRSGFVTT